MNVVGEEDESDDGDTQISNKLEDSQSSAGNSSQSSNNRVYNTTAFNSKVETNIGQKQDATEDKMLQIIKKPEGKLDEGEMFCFSIATNVRKIQDPQKK